MLSTAELRTAQHVTELVRTTYRDIVATAPGVTFNVPLTAGRRAPITTGTIDEHALRAYTSGQCHAMALALNLTTGYPMVFIGPDECTFDEDCAPFPERWGWCGCQVAHLGVWTPRDTFLDIHGERTLEDVADDLDLDEPATPAPEGAPARRANLFVVDENCLRWIESDSSWRAAYVDLALSFTAALTADHPA